MSTPLPPRVGLTPLTSSLLPDVGAALQRRVTRKAAVAEAQTTSGASDNAPRLHDSFDHQFDEDDEPETYQSEPVGLESRTYTVGQLIEQVRARKGLKQRVVESGDPDGPEPEFNKHSLMARAVKAMQS